MLDLAKTHASSSVAIDTSLGDGIRLHACIDSMEECLIKTDHRLRLIEDRCATTHVVCIYRIIHSIKISIKVER